MIEVECLAWYLLQIQNITDIGCNSWVQLYQPPAPAICPNQHSSSTSFFFYVFFCFTSQKIYKLLFDFLQRTKLFQFGPLGHKTLFVDKMSSSVNFRKCSRKSREIFLFHIGEKIMDVQYGGIKLMDSKYPWLQVSERVRISLWLRTLAQ